MALFAAVACITAHAHGILLGVNTHVTGNPLVQRPQLDRAREIGFDSVRDAFLWRYAEPAKGIYEIPPSWDSFVHAARQRGIEPLVILCYGNPLYDGGDKPRSREAIEGFVRYATFVVKHFAGRVRYFEIWNEWDTHAGGFPSADAADYAKLFDAVLPAVKRADPRGVFLASASAGGRNRWYEQLARLGIAARADGVAVHPYVYPRKHFFWTSSASDEAERSARQLTEIERGMRRLSGGKTIPIYVTEIGWPTSSDASGVKEGQAASLAQRMLLVFSSLPYVRGVWWYDLVDDGPDGGNSQDRFGLVRQDYAFKSAAFLVQSIAPFIKSNQSTLNPATDLASGVVVVNLGSPSEGSVIAWDADAGDDAGKTRGRGYTVSCSASGELVRGARGRVRHDLLLRRAPAVFFRQNGICRRVQLTRKTLSRP